MKSKARQNPKNLSRSTIVSECRTALEVFVRERLASEGENYRTVFREKEKVLQALFESTSQLRKLEKAGSDNTTLDALRYLSAPPLSADDLKTILSSDRYSSKERHLSVAAVIGELIDTLRFPWASEGRKPKPEEIRNAIRWTAGLWSVESMRTKKRIDESRNQEAAVQAVAMKAGYKRTVDVRRIEQPDSLQPGYYTAEVVVGDTKCDVPIRLGDGRLMGVECKVSNSALNSIKRLVREVGGKARHWNDLFGRQFLPAVVLRGVFNPATVQKAQEEYGIAVYWEHNLKPLERFLRSTLKS